MSVIRTGIYSELDASVQQIRLMRWKKFQDPDEIEVKLETYQIDQCPAFNALSYAWGDPSEVQMIYLNGIRHTVTRNLYSALNHLRPQLEDQPMWIDALCINQQDVKERENQVGLMKRIYSRAQQVTVWLGEQSDNSDSAFDLLEMLAWQDDPVNWLFRYFVDGQLRNLIKAINRLYSRPYWRRLWIVQEIAVGAQVRFHCGCRSANLQLFDAFDAALVGTPEPLQGDESDSMYLLWGMLGKNLRASGPGESFRKAVNATSLLDLLRRHRYSKVTDPRDKIYGLLGLKDMDPPFTVDYTVPTATIYRRFARGDGEEHLRVKGFCVGKITYCTEPSSTNLLEEIKGSFENILRLLRTWRLEVDKQCDGAASDVEAFSLLVSYQGASYDETIPSPPALSRDQLSLNRERGKAKLDFHVAAARISGCCLCFSRSATPGLPPDEPLSWQNSESGQTSGLTRPPKVSEIPVSGSGSICTLSLAPGITQAGDFLCVFLGHKRPVILRPLEDEHGRTVYRFIGEADAYGFESGQGMDGLQDGTYHLQDFELV
ncbi:MAG: hypothetical protein Q9212_006982 [Teloschistes hypoglaucus]